jgi:hypothetical protein
MESITAEILLEGYREAASYRKNFFRGFGLNVLVRSLCHDQIKLWNIRRGKSFLRQLFLFRES